MKKVLLSVLTIILFLFVMCIGLYFFHERQITKYSNYCINEIKTQLWDDIWDINNNYINRTYAWKFLYSWSVTFDWKDYNFYCKVLLQNNKVDLELQEVSSKEFDEIQESKVLSIEELKETFTGNIINWSELEEIDITWDNTLYYNDKFWFAVNLWERWKWWKIELKTHNEQFWKNAISRSIHFYKEWFDYDVYSLSIDKIEKYDSMKKQDVFWTEDEFEKWIKWKNNKYFFVGYANDQLAPYIDITDEYQQLFLVWFVFYDIEESVSEESKIWRNSINLWEELLWNEEGVIFEPKKWKWQMPCIWWCDNWKDTEYVEWWYYEYTNPSLWVKITTPDWENGNWNTIFLEKRETPLFLLSWNSIYSLEYVRDNEELKFAEYIKWYKKDSLMSLEELLDKTYSSSWCNLRKYDINQNLGTHFKWAWEYYYEFVSNDGNVYNDCISEDWENWVWPIIFIESKDWEKFYKVSIWDWCAPWPCSIFWKIELL